MKLARGWHEATETLGAPGLGLWRWALPETGTDRLAGRSREGGPSSKKEALETGGERGC